MGCDASTRDSASPIVSCSSSSTPKDATTSSAATSATRGGIYGTEKTLWNLGPLGFPVRTAIRGFFQSGGSTITPGINGVTRSGLDAAAAALNCAPEELLSATGQHLRIFPADAPSCWPAELRPR